MKSLIVCSFRGIIFYPLAYALEFGDGRKFDLVIANGQKLPLQVCEYLTSIGINVIDLELAKENQYESILVQPYQDFSNHLNFLSSFNFKNISYYSDALRNGMYSLVGIDERANEFIYFGFELIEETFLDNLTARQMQIPRTVVSFEAIRETWVKLGLCMDLKFDSEILNPEDLLIVMRHWGRSPNYPFQDGKKLEDYLLLEMENWPTSRRVVIKEHPWLETDELFYETLRSGIQRMWGSQLYFWSDLFPVPEGFPELGSPEYALWSTKQSLGNFYAFDGSLNSLVALVSPTTSIQYPNPVIFDQFFKFKSISNLVLEQTTWQKGFVSDLRAKPKNHKIVVKTSGVPYEKMISKMSLFEQASSVLKGEVSNQSYLLSKIIRLKHKFF